MSNPLDLDFVLPSSKTKAFIFNKGYFSKSLLPLLPNSETRYCEVRCLLPKLGSSIEPCNRKYSVKWNDTTTSSFLKYLARQHPNIPKNIKEEARAKNLERLESKL